MTLDLSIFYIENCCILICRNFALELLHCVSPFLPARFKILKEIYFTLKKLKKKPFKHRNTPMLSSPICKKEKHEIPLKCRGVERDNVVFDGGCVAPGENWRKLIAVSGRLSGA